MAKILIANGIISSSGQISLSSSIFSIQSENGNLVLDGITQNTSALSRVLATDTNDRVYWSDTLYLDTLVANTVSSSNFTSSNGLIYEDLIISGSTIGDFTGSLFGTASFAISTSFAISSSHSDTSISASHSINSDLLGGNPSSYYLPTTCVSGTATYIPKFTGTNSIGNSVIYQSSSFIAIGTTFPTQELTVSGSISASGDLYLDQRLYDITDSSGSNQQILTAIGNGNKWYNLIDISGSVTGSGTPNYLTIWDTQNSLSSSGVYQDNNGNIGIGTTNPTTSLHLYTNVAAKDVVLRLDANSTGQSYIELDRQTSNGCVYIKLQDASVNKWSFGSFCSDRFDILEGHSTACNRLSIIPGGNIGIGTITPTQNVHIAENIRVEGAYYDSSNSPGTPGQILKSTVIGTEWSNIVLSGGQFEGNFTGSISGSQGTFDNITVIYTGSFGYVITDTISGSKAYIYNLYDSNESSGSVNQILTSTEDGIEWKSDISASNVKILNDLSTDGNIHLYGITENTEAFDRILALDVNDKLYHTSNISASRVYTGEFTSSLGGLFTDTVTIDGDLLVTGQSLLFSASYINITSSNVNIGDNIITLNAYSPFKTYAGIEMHDSGSGAIAQFLWDSSGNFFFVSGSTATNSQNQVLLGPDGKAALTAGYLPVSYNSNELSSSILYQGGTNIGIGTTFPTQKLEIHGNIRVTGSYYDSNNSAGTSGQILSSTATGTDWVDASEVGIVDGSGTLNYLAKWTPDGNSLGDSVIYDDGSHIGIGTLVMSNTLTVNGDVYIENSLTASNITTSYIDLDLLSNGAAPPYKAGRLFYDDEEGALTFYNNESDISLQVGQEFYIRVYNDTGGPILNGNVVYISGSQGDNPYVWKAAAEDHTTTISFDNHVIGVTTHTIEDKSVGYVTTQGIVRGIDTTAFNAGDILFVSQSAGELTNTPPQFPYDILQVGYVIRSHSNGFIYVHPQESIHFSNISGLSGSFNAHNGDLWVYQSNNAWTHTKLVPEITSSVISSSNIYVSSLYDSNSSSGSSGQILSSTTTGTDWTNLIDISGAITGSGTTCYIPVWESSQKLGNSNLYKDVSGNIGIGTTLPGAKLDVRGTGIIGRTYDTGSYDPSDFDLILTNGGSDTSLMLYDDVGSAYHSSLIQYSNGVLSLGLNNSNSANSIYTTSAVNINSSGVGIGTTSLAGSTRFQVTNNTFLSGSVGILTCTYNDTLNIGCGAISIKNKATDSCGLLLYQDTSDTSKIYNYYSGPLLFGTSNTERMRILANGNVGIGTSTPTRQLTVYSSSAFNNPNSTILSYTTSDNSALVGSITKNVMWITGSIQLGNNNDAIVFGRGTATFLKDEELGFGWGGGWYMTDSTYIRSRGNKTIYGQDIELISSSSIRIGSTEENRYDDNSGYGGISLHSNDAYLSMGSNIQVSNNTSKGWANLYLNKIDPISSITDADSRLIAFYGDGSRKWDLNLNSDGDIGFNNIGTGDFLVLGGNVGLGTLTPPEKLTVNGNISASGNFYLDGAIYDVNDSPGAVGSILTSTGTAVEWASGDINISGAFEGNFTGSITGSYGIFDNITIVETGSFGYVVSNVVSGSDFYIFNLNDRNDSTGSNQQILISTKNGIEWTDYTVISGSMSGSGSPNYTALWTSDNELSSSNIYQDGNGNIGINTTSPTKKLHVYNSDILINGVTVGIGGDGTEASSVTNTTLGYNALSSSTNSQYNVAIGYQSLTKNISSYYNVGIGYRALCNIKTGVGNCNVAIGYLSMEYNRNGFNNVAIGADSLSGNESGSYNVAIGVSSGLGYYQSTDNYNISIGDSSGYNDGACNISIGYLTTNTSGANNSITIGHNSVGLGSNTTKIGNNNTVCTVIPAGNVGIGITNPLKTLHLLTSGATDASICVDASVSGNAYLTLDRQTSLGCSYINFQDAATDMWGIGTYGADRLDFVENSTTCRMSIIPGGNVGINTVSPTQKLQIDGNIRVTGSYYDSNNNAGSSGQILSSTVTGTDWTNLIDVTGAITGSGTTCYIPVWEASQKLGNSNIYKNVNGNIGIGTTSLTDARLKVHGSGGLKVDDKIASCYSGGDKAFLSYSGGGNGIIGACDSSGTYKVCISSYSNSYFTGGNVGIGEVNPAYLLHLSSSNNTNILGMDVGPYATVRVSANSTSKYTTCIHMDNTGLDFGHDSTLRSLNLRTGNTDRLTILGGGNVGIGITDPGEFVHIRKDQNTETALYIQNNNDAAGAGALLKIAVGGQSADGDARVSFTIGNGGSDWSVGVDNSDDDKFKISGGVEDNFPDLATNPRLTISSSGNVGIATEDPTARLHVEGSGSTLFKVDGYNGTLFSVEDDLSDSLMSVNDAAGLPVFEVFADDTIIGGRYNQNDFYLQGSDGNIGIGTSLPTAKFEISSSTADPLMRIKGSGGENILYVSGSGNVGLGTLTPPEKLTVNGNISSSGDFYLDGAIYDVNNSAGTSGQILSSTGTGTDWVNIGDIPDAISGSGTPNYTALWTDGNTLSSSNIYQDGNGNIGIGISSPSYKLEVNGEFAAPVKHFIVTDPTNGKKLVHSSLEGPENGVYIRGNTSSDVINLPKYWDWLIDENTISVNLTPIGKYQQLYVKHSDSSKICVNSSIIDKLLFKKMCYSYTIFAERKDVNKLQIYK